MAEEHVNLRLETFCDGVFAIAMTLLIVDIKLPASAHVETTADLWLALEHLLPSISAFILSFTVILTTWVNHHNSLLLIDKSSPRFMFANGLLLLTVVFVPFPTALLGEHLLTDHAAPAVVLYDATMALQALGWILITETALRDHLTKDEGATVILRDRRKYGLFAFIVYSLCAIMAWWFPLTLAIITTLIWIFWLLLAITSKHT